MSKKWITILVAAVIGTMLLPSAALATCVVTVVNNITVHDATAAASVTDPVPYTAGDKVDGITVNNTGALNLNKEGVAERTADLLITDDGSGLAFCFTSGSDLVITYNAIMTLPTTPGNLAIPGNLDIFDSKGIAGLTVTSATITSVFAANTTNSQLDIKIGQTGTTGNLAGAASGVTGAALRVKNIRINASKAGATVLATFLGTANTVGNSITTVVAANNLWGLATGPSAIAAGGVGGGVQSSGVGLALPNSVATKEGFNNSFRTPGTAACNSSTAANDTCYSQVANDIATVATSTTLSVTGIPSGVTVTFPSSLSTSATDAADGLTFTNRAGSQLTNSGAPGSVTVTYDTANNTAALANTMVLQTADNADVGTNPGTAAGTSNPNCKISGTPAVLGDLNSAGATPAFGTTCNANPKIGVKVGATSLAGTASLWWVFGQAQAGDTANFPGDDIAANPVASGGVPPQYTGSGRVIIKGKSFFTIFPTRTTLLYPFISTRGGWNSGLSIANTALDTGIFAANTVGQTGGVTLYFFGVNPDTNAAVADSVNSDLTSSTGKDLSSACRGLDASGRVVPGAQTACVVKTLLGLLPTKPSNFDGYVIAVTGFNFGHGFSVVLDASGAPFSAVNALVLGGNGATARGAIGAGESLAH